MKKLLIIPSIVFLLTVTSLPALVLGADPYSTEDPSGDIVTCGESADNCTYQALFKSINNGINFVILYLLVPLSVIAILRAGIMLVLYGENPKQHQAAVESMKNIIIGMFLVFGAFVIVKTFVVALAGTGPIGAELRAFFK